MKRRKKLMVGATALVVVIQFIQPVRNKSTSIPLTDIEGTMNVPDTVEAILKNACYDCHSNNTNYPWYSWIQPFGWLLRKHITDGKSKLNFNEFGSYNRRRQISKMTGIINSIKDGSMPLRSYRIIHTGARLSKNDQNLVIDWSTRAKDSLMLNN